MQTSKEGATGAHSGMPVRVRRTLIKGSTEGAVIGGIIGEEGLMSEVCIYYDHKHY